LDGSRDDEGDATAAERVDRRQLLLVACCLGAVLVAAALAPTPVDVSTPERPGTPVPGDEGTGGGGSAGGGGDGNTGDESVDASGDSRVVDGAGDPAPVPGDTAPPTAGCGVVLEDEPVPGSRATVGVFRDGDPLTDVRVRFDGDPVGRTGERGRASGVVPYNRTLTVAVGLDADCEFFRRQFDGEGDRGTLGPAGAVVGGPGFGVEYPEVGVEYTEAGGNRAGVGPVSVAQSGTGGGSANNTGTYAVRGDVSVTVRGDAYPGSSVAVVASIEGVPMRRANVTLDGTRVGRTGPKGGATLTVPDGSQEVPVGVGRGEFEGEGTVDVLLLTAALESREGFLVPGETAAVVAEVDERPASDVSVRVGGRPVGSTGTDGDLGFTLPTSPGKTVVASTSRQSVTVPLWTLYVPTGLNLFVLVAVGVVATSGARLRWGSVVARRVGVGWAILAVADVALIVGELPGLGVSILGMAVVGIGHQRRRVIAGGGQAAGTAVGVVMALRRTALWVTDCLTRLMTRVERFLGRTWTRLTSFEHLAALVGGLVSKVVETAWVYLTLRRVGVAAFALAELAVATARWGHEGLFASVAGLTVLAVLVALWRRDDVVVTLTDSDEDDGTTDRRVRRTGATNAEESEERRRSIRELWRQFARRVVQGSWRTRTPGEVARAAVDRGFPQEPVEELTEAFRDVEYGAGPATTRRERAKAAFDSLEQADEEEEDG